MELLNLIIPLLRWWWLLLISCLLAAASSFYVVQQQPNRYRSSTTLMVGQAAINDPNPNSTQFVLAQHLAQIYADMAKRNVVTDATKAALNVTQLPEFNAVAIPQTQLIEISVIDFAPDRAQIIANELANQLIQVSPSNISAAELERQDFVEDQLSLLQTQIEATLDEIEAKNDELGDQFSAREIERIRGEIVALESKQNNLQTRYASLLAATEQGDVNAINVIEPATLPANPMQNGNIATILTAIAAALALSGGAAYFLEYLDDTVKHGDDPHAQYRLAKLASVPEVRLPTGGDPLITLRDPMSYPAEAFRTLRTNIQFSTLEHNGRTLLVTSAHPGEGKSFITANLATMMAKAGKRVLLIDADLRKPTQHLVFRLEQKSGLSNMLLEYNSRGSDQFNAFANRFIQRSLVPDLDVIVSGPLPPAPAELVGNQKFTHLVKSLLSRYDLIIIDSPPVLAVTDPIVMSSWVDSVVLVAQANRTRRNSVNEAADRLRRVNANIAGIVVNQAKISNTGDYYAGHYFQKLDTIVTTAVGDEEFDPVTTKINAVPITPQAPQAPLMRTANGYHAPPELPKRQRP